MGVHEGWGLERAALEEEVASTLRPHKHGKGAEWGDGRFRRGKAEGSVSKWLENACKGPKLRESVLSPVI